MIRILLFLVLFAPLVVLAEETQDLTWNHPMDTVQYRLYGDGQPIAETPVGERVITAPKPKEGVTYTVTAFIGDNESAHSNEVKIPPAPDGLRFVITTTTTTTTTIGSN